MNKEKKFLCKNCNEPIDYDRNGAVFIHKNGLYWCHDIYMGQSATPQNTKEARKLMLTKKY